MWFFSEPFTFSRTRNCSFMITCPLGACLRYYTIGSGLVGEDDALGSSGAVAARIESSYMINLCDLDMRHVKYFTFVHGTRNY
ncbi:cleavage and polyadenylation specificity factor subunit 1-like isoform X2 [Glycine soja]|uniref:cleavage and polyadenylation specificity factor subunit 1-like isoform X2 n=1 Tax=Glycine soja TaxID=3848 RepID=UPI00103F97AD|nr:cleavage and polyadenylation specificity factor subunit 1-like isoform X2 [Glycine soja]